MNKEKLREIVGDDVELVKSVELLELKPNDIIVLKSDRKISAAACASIQASMEREFPGHRCLVFPEGWDIQIIRQAR